MIRALLALLILFTSSVAAQPAQNALTFLKLPPGFNISIYAFPVPGARAMALGSKNIVFVGTRYAGIVYAIVPDPESQPYGTKVIKIAEGLRLPNGVAFKDGSLYVADIDRIYRYDNIEQNLENPPQAQVIIEGLPDAGSTDDMHHEWRYIRIGPDKKLYISIGLPCNACLSQDPRFGTIMRMNLDGSQEEIYARGIRISNGFDWDPFNQHLWFTDDSRDWMGDFLPPEEINYAPIKGMNFGAPYFYGNSVPDPMYGEYYLATDFTPPALELPAHVAPAGMVFYTGTMFPPEYRNQLFIAEHGSWNKSQKIGYQVVMARVSANRDQISSVVPFVTGWLVGEQVYGRPVDLLIMPDGSMLISDDFGEAIYRVTYGPPQPVI